MCIRDSCAAPAPTSTPLWMVAFGAKEFRRKWRVPSRVSVGKDGMRMVVTGAGGGRLLWRLLKAVPSHQLPPLPEAMVRASKDPLVRETSERAKKDLRIERAFRKVKEYVDGINTPADLVEARRLVQQVGAK